MSVLGQCPIWVLKRPDVYLADEAGWVLAFGTPGKAMTFVDRKSDWRCQVFPPDQLLLLIADMHELGSLGLRVNPSPSSSAIGRRYPLDSLVADHLLHSTSF
jgi:hypothetical protein